MIFKCSACDKSFWNSSSLQEHFDTHSANSLYICKLCGKGWTCASDLRKHFETHTTMKKKKYPCRVCGKEFSQSYTMKRHLDTHPEKCSMYSNKQSNNHAGEMYVQCVGKDLRSHHTFVHTLTLTKTRGLTNVPCVEKVLNIQHS